MYFKQKLYLVLCFLFLNCSLIYPTKNPIDTIHYVTGKNQSKNLIIMLPGRGDKPYAYKKNGFIKLINELGVDSDVIVVDAHFGYYYKRNLITHLYEDVIIPSKLKGYNNIWILGISMGGIGALLYAKQYPKSLNGLVVFAPFLGDREIIDEINVNGGLLKWTPKESLSNDDYQRTLWYWLKEYSNPENDLPRLILGYGKDDKFAFSNKLLSAVLPNNQVYILEGNHDWDTWNRLFYRFLIDKFVTSQ